MVDVSDSELTTIENALESVIQALAADESPEATDLKQTCLDAQQIVSGKLDKGNMADGVLTNPAPGDGTNLPNS